MQNMRYISFYTIYMAKEPKILSFHMNSALQHSTHGFSLLQASKRELRNNKTGVHKHDFWQLEMIVAGSCYLQAGSLHEQMHAGQYVLIPPAQDHMFSYGRKICEFISVKYMWAEDDETDLHIAQIQPQCFIPYIVTHNA